MYGIILGRKVIDTSTGWLLFTGFLVLSAIGAHFLAEYTFHLYDITPIDKYLVFETKKITRNQFYFRK